MWVADNSTHTIVNFDNGQNVVIAAVLTDFFMGNQEHLPKAHQSQSSQSQSSSLRHADNKMSRTERVSARSNWPWSNTDECHHI
jgi:hypothetical protein